MLGDVKLGWVMGMLGYIWLIKLGWFLYVRLSVVSLVVLGYVR